MLYLTKLVFLTTIQIIRCSDTSSILWDSQDDLNAISKDIEPIRYDVEINPHIRELTFSGKVVIM